MESLSWYSATTIVNMQGHVTSEAYILFLSDQVNAMV